MRFVSSFFAVSILALLVFAQTVKADSSSITLARGAAMEEAPDTPSVIRLPVILSGRSPLLGRFTIQLTKKRKRNWPAVFEDSMGGLTNDESELMLFRGHAVIKRGGKRFEKPVAASVGNRGGIRTVQIHLEAELPRRRLVVLTGVRKGALSGQIALRESKIAKAFLEANQCAELESSEGAPISFDAPARAAVGTRIIELATDADFQFFQRHGADSNNAVASIVNASQAIYQNGLNLEFQIVSQRVATAANSLTSTDPSILLNQYGTFLGSSPHPVSYDVTHLFTGKDLDGSVVGIAWLSVVCRSSNRGLTQDLNSSISPIIFAHELGHNFGAAHDTGLPQSLMYPAAGPNAATQQNFFSTTSINQIQSYLASYGACLSLATGQPTPTTTPTRTPTATPTSAVTPTPAPTAVSTPPPRVPKYRIKISRSRHRSYDSVTLRIRFSDGSLAPQVPVRLMRLNGAQAAKTVRTSLSDNDGSKIFRVVKSGRYRFSVGELNQLSQIFVVAH